MNTINFLKSMSEAERIEWIANAKTSYLNVALKDYGVKGIANMNKLEKIVMLTKIVEENIEDADAKRVMDDTERLKEEIEIRQCYAETIEGILYARYKNGEITYDELRKTCNAYDIDIPLSYNEKNSTKLVDENCDLFSWYEHHDCDGNVYYSILDRKYEWENISLTSYDCRNDDWDVQQFFARNTVDNGDLQLACTFDEDLNYMLCMYKNHKLLGTFADGDIYDIKVVVDYDDRLTDEDLDAYEELLDLLNEQQEEYCRIVDANELLKNKLKMAEEYNRQLVIDEIIESKC